MEANPVVNQTALKQKFDELADKSDNKVDFDQLRQILAHVQLDQPVATTRKMVKGLINFAQAKSPINLLKSLNNGKSQVEKPQEQGNEQSEDEQEQKEKEWQEENPKQHRMTFQQVQKCVSLLTNKIKYQIWKLTEKIYNFQNRALRMSKRNSFAIKDPGHLAKVNILVGEELPNYNSHLRLKATKKAKKGTNLKRENQSKIGVTLQKKQNQNTQSPTKIDAGKSEEEVSKQKNQKLNHRTASFQKQEEQVSIKIKFMTSKMEQSNFFVDIWKNIYQIIQPMVQGEFSDGQYFISTIQISTQVTEQFFQISIASHNPDLNELLFAATNFLDVIFKTQVKFALQFLFEFGFDLKNLVQNKNASLYDFLTRNVRIKLNYQGSEYVSALKELMILNDAFQGLKWVADDGQSLALIALISSHVLQLNLKFKNAQHKVGQQESLKQLLTVIQEELRPLLQEMKQESPETYEILVNALKKAVKIQANIYDVQVRAEVYLQNIDKIIFFKDNGEDGNSESNQKEGDANQQPPSPQFNNLQNPPENENQQPSESDSDS